MEPNIVPKPANVAISSSTQNNDTSCATQSPNALPMVDTDAMSSNAPPTNQDPDHDKKKTSAQEEFIPCTAASKNPLEELSADKEDDPSVIWCRVELKGPGKWAKCALFQKDGDHGPQDDIREDDEGEDDTTENDTLSQHSPVQVLAAREPPFIKFSNKFVDRKDSIVVVHSWPEALDLDQEREKPTGSKLQRDAPVIEFITTVGTNLEHVSYTSAMYKNTRSILSDPRIATDVIRREVVIHSGHIINAFKAMITYYPSLELLGITMTIPEPYCVFYHYYQEIKALRSTHNASTKPPIGAEHSETTSIAPESYNSEASKHLKILCDFIEGRSLQEVELEQERYRQHPPVATYRMMWLLFKPGTRVYHFSGGRATAGIVLSVQTDIGSKKPGLRSLKLWHLDFDGFKLGRRDVSHDFKPFDGERRISELPVCPCDIYDAQDNNRLREELISRGRRFWKFLPGVQVDYNGILPDEAIEWVGSFLNIEVMHQNVVCHDIDNIFVQRGRVIIDPTTYIKYSQVDDNPSQRFEDRFREVLMPPVVGKVQDAMNTKVKLDPDRRDYGSYPLPRFETTLEKLNRHRREAQELTVYEDGPWAEYENIIPGDTTSLELDADVATQDKDARYLLCPKDVIGFDLKTRRWSK